MTILLRSQLDPGSSSIFIYMELTPPSRVSNTALSNRCQYALPSRRFQFHQQCMYLFGVKNRGEPGQALISPICLQLLRDCLSMGIHYQSKVDFGVSYSQEMRASDQNSQKTPLSPRRRALMCLSASAVI